MQAVLVVLVLLVLCLGSEAPGRAAERPTLYLVGYAHLDTQWRWQYPQVIGEFLPHTLRANFGLIERYPDYIFNFTGANRYAFIQEYFPQQFEQLKRYVRAGRWFPGGSSVEECDLDLPSVESLWRQILYGNEYFRRQLGVAGEDFMDPDAFGYPASLPSVLAHAGLKGFSTQKLDPQWGSAAGIPFNLGVWLGPDGRGIVAALNPGSYDSHINGDMSTDPGLAALLDRDQRTEGVALEYRYYGTGDTGGAPDERSVQNLERSVHGDGAVRIVSAPSDLLFRTLTPAQIAGLPRYRGDLLLTQHSAGSLSSEAYVKKWNNRNEVLADAAERASVAASWLGAQPYPRARLDRAWRLVLGAQFHDILAGTATPQAYEYSWNDQILALNQFSSVLTGAVRGVAAGLDTRGRGIALVVYNPLSIERQDVVSAELGTIAASPDAVRVVGPDGRAVPAQLEQEEGKTRVVFVARVPAVGFAVYDVQPQRREAGAGDGAQARQSTLRVDRSGLENARYRVRIDAHGDIASIFDRALHRELLAAPLRLALLSEHPHEYPAWNMEWDDQRRPPRGFVGGAVRVRVVERGPARVALQIERTTEGSRFSETIRLASGDGGNRIELVNAIDWRTRAAALKETFPLVASNPVATYNLGLGTIARGNDDPKKYEVPAHQWFDLTDRSGAFGVTVLSGAKYGSDKPDDHTLRLTLLYTPGARVFRDQATQDWGHHEFIYGLAAHAGDWRASQTAWQAERLNAPLLVFRSAAHAGALGKSFSLVHVDSTRVRIVALKHAERGDELIVRMLEMTGATAPQVAIRFAAPVRSLRELDAQERPLVAVSVAPGATGATGATGSVRVLPDGTVLADFGPYQPRTFALRLAAAPSAQQLHPPRSFPIALRYQIAVASRHGTPGHAGALGFDASGAALPAELLPADIEQQGVRFTLGPSAGLNALPARGQRIALPQCDCSRLYLLAASDDHDRSAAFSLGSTRVTRSIEPWSGYVGQGDRRIFSGGDPRDPGWDANEPPLTVTHIRRGYIRPAPVAWFASHRHDASGRDLPYSYAYLFSYAIPIPSGARELTLPDDPHLKVLAVTAAADLPALEPAARLYGRGVPRRH